VACSNSGTSWSEVPGSFLHFSRRRSGTQADNASTVPTRFCRRQAAPLILDPLPKLPQPYLQPIEESGQGQELSGDHPHPYDDNDEAGSRRRQERETRHNKRRPTDKVDHPPILRRLTLLAATAVAMVAGLKAMARFDLLGKPPPLSGLPKHIPSRPGRTLIPRYGTATPLRFTVKPQRSAPVRPHP
jgi:hypothetical protein